jgi:hypothetical protein
MQRLDPSPETWRAWRSHLAGQTTTVALAACRAELAGRPGTGRWSGPALLPLGLSSGRFAPLVATGPVRTGELSLDDDGLCWTPADGTGPMTLSWDDVASAEVVRAWWRSRAGLRLVCHDREELWFDATQAHGLEKVIASSARG